MSDLSLQEIIAIHNQMTQGSHCGRGGAGLR